MAKKCYNYLMGGFLFLIILAIMSCLHMSQFDIITIKPEEEYEILKKPEQAGSSKLTFIAAIAFRKSNIPRYTSTRLNEMQIFNTGSNSAGEKLVNNNEATDACSSKSEID